MGQLEQLESAHQVGNGQFAWRWTTFEVTKARKAVSASQRTRESLKGRRKEKANQRERAHGRAVTKERARGRKEDLERKERVKRKERQEKSLEHATTVERLGAMPSIAGAAREWRQLRRQVEEPLRRQVNRDHLQ